MSRLAYLDQKYFSEVFIAQGIWTSSQVDPSYDGSPANSIANEGSIAQQGFASAEPFNYKNTYEEWGEDVKYQLHDAVSSLFSDVSNPIR